MTISAVSPAAALPSKSAKIAEARAVKAQIDRLDTQVEIAAERYNEASTRHAKLVVERDAAAARMAKAQKHIDHLQGQLRGRANNMYRTGPLGFLEVLLDSRSFEEFATTWDVINGINKKDARVVGQLKVARAEANAARKVLVAKERDSRKQVAVMASNKREIANKLSERKSRLSGIESEIAAIEAAEAAAERRRVAAARAADAAARAAAASRASYSAPARSFPKPTRAARSEVVNIAMRYLGAPYQWGASGPNSFDCSGFTMFVYSQVGVSLPHHSGSQIGAGQRVSRGDLEPGDLVFFGSPIHHVGIYVGGGSYIHAPHTGDVVKISPLDRGDYAGACRP